MKFTYRTTLRKSQSKQVAGIVVPEDLLLSLGAGKRPPVRVTLAGYTYRSTVGKMGDSFMISLSSENLAKAGLRGDESLEVTVELDTEPRNVEPPDDLREALIGVDLLSKFEACAPSYQKEFVRQVEDAKTEETRRRRIERVLDALRQK